MDQQRRAIDALAPFLALSKAASSPRSAADLVTQAISAQHTYLFGELLQTAAIQGLRSDGQYASYCRLLEIFAFGTYQDYVAQEAVLPRLTVQQTTKLRLLTLMTLASTTASRTDPRPCKNAPAHRDDSSSPRSHDALSYDSLRRSLGLQTTSQIEQLVTEAIYAELMVARLDPAHGIVQVSSVAPCRDIRPGQLAALGAEVDAWADRCDGVLLELQSGIGRVVGQAKKRMMEQEVRRREAEVTESSHVHGRAGERSGGGPLGLSGLADGDAMDVDGMETARGSRGGRR